MPVHRLVVRRRFIKLIGLIVALTVLFYTFLLLKNRINDKKIEEKQKKDLLCIVLTSENTFLKRATTVFDTWGQDCDHILFACNCEKILLARNFTKENKTLPPDLVNFKDIKDLPILNLNIVEDYNRMGEKVLLIIKLVYGRFLTDYKWFLMGDDDTYIFVENVYKFTSKLDPFKALMYGFKWIVNVPGGYLGGGSGILFGNEAFRRIGISIENKACDKHVDMYGDITIGMCAIESNVSIGDSNDELGRPRFNQQNPREHYYGPVPSPLTQAGSHNGKIGKECCSLETISFHYVQPNEMYEIYANKTYLKDLLT